jgi:hypothetical protein
VNVWFEEHRLLLNNVIEEGRVLAESGRMELEVHDALEQIDDLVVVSNRVALSVFDLAYQAVQIKSGLDANRIQLLPALAKADSLNRDMQTLSAILDRLNHRDLSDSQIAVVGLLR